MLTELRIKSFAIISELHLDFEQGLTVITGETGAGKSIILGALGLIQGERAAPDMIRTGEDEAVVEAVFNIAGHASIQEKLGGMGFEAGDALVLKRIVSRSEKNRVFINGSPATLGMLSALSESLIDICGQREHQVFLNPDNHIDILDDFGLLSAQRNEYGAIYARYQALREERRDLQGRLKSRNERSDYLTFQLQEIDQAALKKGEEEALQEEKKVLDNIARLEVHAGAAYENLYGREGSVLEQLVPYNPKSRRSTKSTAGSRHRHRISRPFITSWRKWRSRFGIITRLWWLILSA